MSKGLKNIFKNKFISNFSYLTLIQFVSVATPLVIYPFLILTLGSELYGKVIYAVALNAYLMVLVNYGFDISVVRRVAEAKHNRKKLRQIFKNTFWAKLLLLLGSYLLLFLGVWTIPFFRENTLLLLLTTLVTVGELLLPRWFFLGVEELKYTSIATVLTKILSLILLFIFIDSQEDFLMVPLLMGLGSIVGGVYSMRFAFKLMKTNFWSFITAMPSWSEIRSLLKEGFSFFLSRGFVVIREKAGILIVGQLFGFQEVSVFDLVMKIVKVLTIPLDMINTVVFPRVAETKNLNYVKKAAGIALLISCVFYLIIILFPFDRFDLFNNTLIQSSIDLLYIFGFGLIMQVFVYFLGNTVLVVFGYDREFNYTVVFGGIIYLLCLAYGYVGEISLLWIGYCTLISYASIIITRVYFVNKYKLWR